MKSSGGSAEKKESKEHGLSIVKNVAFLEEKWSKVILEPQEEGNQRSINILAA